MDRQATELDALEIDLSDLALDDVDVLIQDGSRGTPDFAASTVCCDACGNCYSCTTSE